MGFSRQEYWSGFSIPYPRDLPDPGIKPTSLVSPAWAGGFFTPEPLGKASQEIDLLIKNKTKQNKTKQKTICSDSVSGLLLSSYRANVLSVILYSGA